MSEAFTARKISDRIYWVGAIDWSLRNFHGYLTSQGTTYNAFLVKTDKLTLIDTVKPQFFDEMMSRIRSVANPKDIDIIISNHSELDHSGCLPRLIAEVQPSQVYASKMGIEALANHFHWDIPILQADPGTQIDLGGAHLHFAETRMLHWPDSMFSFLEEEGALFSNDAFGMHLASSELFADELDASLLHYEAAKYYANILMPLSPLVAGLIKKLPSFGWDVKMIAPDHGPIWRKDPQGIIRDYERFAAQKPSRKAVVVYDTMWQSTATMARAICDGLTDGGAVVRMMPLEGSHRSDVVTELLDAGGLVVGAPTMNNQLYPTMADTMTYLKGLKPRNLVGAAFGSYGWSGESIKHLDEMLNEMKVELVREGLKVRYVPTAEALAECRALGVAIANKMMQKLG